MNKTIFKLGELFCGPGGIAWGALNANIGNDNFTLKVSNDGKNLVLSPFEDVSLEKDFYKIKFSYEELTKFLNKNYRIHQMLLSTI